jgi:hypothetical protein
MRVLSTSSDAECGRQGTSRCLYELVPFLVRNDVLSLVI